MTDRPATTDPSVAVDDLTTVSVGAHSYRLALPDRETDYIQRGIAARGEPYESQMLADMASRLVAGDVVVDVGANVGNHTLYLAVVAGCRVEAVEPDASLADAIRRSARANDVTASVTVHAMALGAAAGTGSVVTPDPSNLGRQYVRMGEGDVPVRALDALDLPRPVRAIKVDVEGTELDVLRGGRDLLLADRPLLYVECATDGAFGAVAAWLDELGYAYWETYNATPTHLFLPAEGMGGDQLARRLLMKTARDSFRATEVAQGLRARLDAANAKYRSSTQAYEALKRQQLELVGQLTGVRDQLAASEAAAEGLARERDEARHWLGERERERDEARDWLGERERERDEARDWLGERERERDEARHWLGERERERDEARHWLGERERERDEARQVVGDQERERDRLREELTQAQATATRVGGELTEARSSTARAQHEATAAREEQSRVHQELVAAAAESGAQRQRIDDLVRSSAAAWAEAGELGTAAVRRRAEAERLVREREAAEAQRDEALRLRGVAVAAQRAAVAAEEAALAGEQAAREAEQVARQAEADARAEVARLRQSVSFRSGRELDRATRSLSDAAALPVRLWRLSRERPDEQVRLALPDAPVVTPPAAVTRAPQVPEPVVAPDLGGHGRPTVPTGDDDTRRLRVAAIVDDFTGLSLEPECELTHLTPAAWRTELETARPQLLFVESAWRGKGGVWHNTVGYFPTELREIVAWCRDRGIPTAFWNKEDPVHFSTFLTTATAFDHVFTTDIDCIGRYKAALGHDRVHLLPFAVQPRTHHPLEELTREDAICFAGSYYRRYPERTRDLDSFLEHLPRFRPVEIFDRNAGSTDPDYAFPQDYQAHVVGTLPPEEIARAYKGYRYAINLNSVKQSQTMFARRVFELLASNTVTVSNFSRGLRMLFGDLVVTTDSGQDAVRRLSDLAESPDRLDRLRLLALRSVMTQHTYADRLAYVVSKVTGAPVPDPLPVVAFVGRAGTPHDVEALLSAVGRQRGVRHRTVLVLGPGLERPTVPGVVVVGADVADEVEVSSVVADAGLVGVLHPDDHHGPHYALDLALGTRYCDADVLGKRTRYGVDAQRLVLVDAGAEYGHAGRLPVRSSLARTSAVASTTLAELCAAADADDVHAEGLDQVSLDRFSYCRDGATLEVAPDVDGDDPAVWTGLTLAGLQARAEAVPPVQDPGQGLRALSADLLEEWFSRARRPGVRFERRAEGWTVVSELADGEFDYVYTGSPVPVEQLWDGPVAEAYVDTAPGLRLQAVFLFLDAEGRRLGPFFAPSQQNASAEIPVGTVRVGVGLRPLGSGSAVIRRIVLGHVSTEPRSIASPADVLIVTNHYPAYDDLYRNGFVHARVRGYRTQGVRADVFRLRPDHALDYDEFQGVDVVTGSENALHRVLASGAHRAVFVHFLDRATWSVVRGLEASVPVVVWLHGAEAQPSWRRAFNYPDPADFEASIGASDERMALWREVFVEAPPNVTFVFVSDFLAQTVQQDVGVQLDPERYRVIHNPIDVDLFTYEVKPVEQRLRILSIRPFATRMYANDLSVAAIEILSTEPWFGELEFHLVGDGPLYDTTVEPLLRLPNVHLERRFLTQQEIAARHREHGVFLVPSRLDTQGVSRDEAMSSGLVPVTSAVGAVQEFVDDESGLVVEPENPAALAHALAELRHRPDLFSRLSSGAADRVRRQSAARMIIAQELALLTPGAGATGRSA